MNDMSLPHLPYGCDSQIAWGFRDDTGRFHCEFHRVYSRIPGSSELDITHQSRLREDLSYWLVTWPMFVGTDQEQPASRWISYAEARKARGSALSFARFSSTLEMREILPGLLHLDDVDARSR